MNDIDAAMNRSTTLASATVTDKQVLLAQRACARQVVNGATDIDGLRVMLDALGILFPVYVPKVDTIACRR